MGGGAASSSSAAAAAAGGGRGRSRVPMAWVPMNSGADAIGNQFAGSPARVEEEMLDSRALMVLDQDPDDEPDSVSLSPHTMPNIPAFTKALVEGLCSSPVVVVRILATDEKMVKETLKATITAQKRLRSSAFYSHATLVLDPLKFRNQRVKGITEGKGTVLKLTTSIVMDLRTPVNPTYTPRFVEVTYQTDRLALSNDLMSKMLDVTRNLQKNGWVDMICLGVTSVNVVLDSFRYFKGKWEDAKERREVAGDPVLTMDYTNEVYEGRVRKCFKFSIYLRYKPGEKMGKIQIRE
mmetsp:Transcript_58076/g.164733  ORF Transcript_58076/g.164733 Transcript_58076/m.164733 type:complete len:294 (+) Transcript_58076:620-1501(+)